MSRRWVTRRGPPDDSEPGDLAPMEEPIHDLDDAELLDPTNRIWTKHGLQKAVQGVGRLFPGTTESGW